MRDLRDTLVYLLAVLCAALMVAALMKWYLAFAWLTVLAIVAYGLLGAYKHGRLGPTGLVLLVVGGVLLVAFAALFALWRPGQLPARLVLGFHPATAVLVYGIWLLPAVTGVVYALTFRSYTLTPEEFERIRNLRADQESSG
ncbi:MAG: hypothetical protein ACUVTQ_10535 [Desulfotomaculales bacterium]